MHIVTKVLVVFAAILSVLLAALTMSYAVNADRIVGDLRAERDLRLAVETRMATAASQAHDERTALQARIAAVQSEVSALNDTIANLERERAQLLKDVRTAEAARASIERKIDELTATAKTQAALIESYRNEVTQLRGNELRYRQNEIQLADRINDLESQNEVLEQNVRALQEQLTEARLAMEGGGARAGDQVSQAVTPRVPIRGRIVSTTRDPATGALLARIDVGTNDQVRENMRLHISRGDTYLGTLLVRQADLQWAIGQIDTLGRPVEIRGGDLVTSSLR